MDSFYFRLFEFTTHDGSLNINWFILSIDIDVDLAVKYSFSFSDYLDSSFEVLGNSDHCFINVLI